MVRKTKYGQKHDSRHRDPARAACKQVNDGSVAKAAMIGTEGGHDLLHPKLGA
jgi:hypothetical protein